LNRHLATVPYVVRLLLDSTDDLSDDDILDLVSNFLVDQFERMAAKAETKFVADMQMSVSWQQQIDSEEVLDQCTDLLNQGEVQSVAFFIWMLLRIETKSKMDFIEGTYLLGSAYSVFSRHGDAVSVLEVTLECDPEHSLAMLNLPTEIPILAGE